MPFIISQTQTNKVIRQLNDSIDTIQAIQQSEKLDSISDTIYENRVNELHSSIRNLETLSDSDPTPKV